MAQQTGSSPSHTHQQVRVPNPQPGIAPTQASRPGIDPPQASQPGVAPLQAATPSVSPKPALCIEAKMFGGHNQRYGHYSAALKRIANFTLFVPGTGCSKYPVLYILPDAQDTDGNMARFSGAQRYAATHGIALVFLGWRSSLCLNSLSTNHQMYDYIVTELPNLLKAHFPRINTSEASICGINMSGHGALAIYFKNPDKYRSVSAFTPLINPRACPNARAKFIGSLGPPSKIWLDYDLPSLIANCKSHCGQILIDQGSSDNEGGKVMDTTFHEECLKKGIRIDHTLHTNYNGSSLAFVATFMQKHITFHAAFLKRT